MSPKTAPDNPRAYLLKGDDELRKAQALDDLLAKLVAADFADFDLEKMDADGATSDRVIAGLSVPPFGSGRRVVLVKHANKMDADEQEKLASRLSKTPESGCLILVNPAVERTGGKPAKGAEVVGALSKAIRQIGEVREFGAPKGREKTAIAGDFARSVFQEAGKTLDSQAMALFIRRVGLDSSMIKMEADKLIAYSGEAKRIGVQDVAAVTTETPEEKVFKMVDAVGARNRAAAMGLLDELFESGDNPDGDAPRTLSMLARQFRLIWQMKQLQAAGVRSFAKSDVPDEIKRELPTDGNLLDTLARQNWIARTLGEQSARFTRDQLVQCFELIARADRMLKGIEGEIDDPRMIMELLVIDLAGAK